jgi:CubicO group peptidase (beta-lactamase class C family)
VLGILDVTDHEQVLREELRSWPGGSNTAAIINRFGVLAATGPDRVYEWASVTKLLTALVVLDKVWSGTLSLDEPAGPPGATVRHLLSHASGLAVESDRVLSPPGLRRIYSNRGYEVVGELLEHNGGKPFAAQLRESVLEPLSLNETKCEGSPAHGAHGPVRDMAALAAELLQPRHFPADRLTEARTTVFPELSGVLPGFGRQDPNDWGLGFEIRGRKSPHWMSPKNSPAAFGHFGRAGAFLWVDPQAGLACVAASRTPFGPWAAAAWPQLSTRVLEVEQVQLTRRQRPCKEMIR